MTRKRSLFKARAAIVLSFLLLALLGISAMVYSHSTDESTRTTHPPAAPVNPSPSNNAKGITGDSITLMWVPQQRYRGDHQTIDQSWVKVSTEGPVYSDQAPANVFNGAVTGTALNIPLDMGQTYYWAVKCHDAEGWGPYSNWKFATNSYPVAEILSVRPNPAREGMDIEFKGSGEDKVDGDAIVEYEWRSSLDREVISKEKNFFSDTLGVGTHEITLRVRDNKGMWSRITEDCTITLKVNANNPPTEPRDIQPVETHSLSPDITWYPSTDEEDDEITYHLKIGTTYQANDVIDISTTQAFYYLQSKELQYSREYKSGKSEKIYYIEIRADDGFDGTSDVVEHRFRVVNHVPLAPDIRITPEIPYISSNLELGIVEKGKDPDGDGVKHTVQWYLGDKLQKEFENDYTIPKSRLEAGQQWEARVTPSDGIKEGVVATLEVEIRNTPPMVKVSHPVEGDVFDEDMELLLDAGNTTDRDAKDQDKLTFLWSSDRDGELGTGERVILKGISTGTHLITVKVSDGINTQERSVTILVEVAKKPIITAKISEVTEKLYVGDRTTINVLVKNEGNGMAKELEMILYNDKNNDFSLQPAEKIGSRHITELDANQQRTVGFDWMVEMNPNNILVRIDGKDLHGRSIETVTGSVTGSSAGGKPSSSASYWEFSEAPSSGKGSVLTIGLFFWIALAVIVLLFLGGIGLFIYLKYSSYDEDEDEIEVGTGPGPSYGGMPSDPYARQLQEQLTQLQGIISTYMPQYAGYAYGQGAFPALPPAGGGSGASPLQTPALPPGPMPYQAYSRQPFYNPFQTRMQQAPLALPPAPSDIPSGGLGEGRSGEFERPDYWNTHVNPYALPTAPSTGAFQPQQPDYSFSSEYQSYPPSPFIAYGANLSGAGATGMGTGMETGSERGPDYGSAGQPGRAQDSPATLIPPRPPRSPMIVVKEEAEGTSAGERAPSAGNAAYGDRLPLLTTIFNTDSMEIPASSPGADGMELISPKPAVITPKILCHICRAPVKITSEERPFITSCEGCGAAVEVS